MPVPETPAVRLGRSLDRLHDLMRRGDLGALPDAAAGMEADLAALSRAGVAPPTASDLAVIRRKLERNAACLQAAARGIRAARRRIAEVRGAASGLGTYDAAGRRAGGPGLPAALVRRV